MYFHGGGWTSYTKNMYTTLSRRLASLGYVVFNCNYRLSPKYKIKHIMEDAVTAINYAIVHAKEYGGDSSQIIIGGDSAGAHIAALLCAIVQDNNKYKDIKNSIKALMLFYGVYDLETVLNSKFNNIKTFVSAVLEHKIGTVEAKKEMEKYSPARYNLSNFPTCFIASGEIDKL